MKNLPAGRVQSLDILKGLVMVLMTLDHTRDYFHYDAFLFSPTDLSQTSVLLFFTRFVTHFCAPVFVLLAGTSAFFVGRRMTKRNLSVWLIKRGLWLVLLEITVVKFAWAFKLDYSMVAVQVIWALGAGMITLAGFIHLNKYVGLSLAFALIFGHNLLDGIHPTGEGFIPILWDILHIRGPIVFENFTLRIAYPVIPWLGLMLAGYYFGELYKSEFDKQKRLKILLYSGIAVLVLFIVLRISNFYGDASPWQQQGTISFSLLSILNVSKYPPSLLYLLITLGPALIFLYVVEKFNFDWLKPISIIGRVPMFWYIIHLYVIHIIACFAAMFTGYAFSDMFLDSWVGLQTELKGYGFSLGVVYAFWAGIVLLLFPIAKWYDNYKRSNRDKWWLSYL